MRIEVHFVNNDVIELDGGEWQIILDEWKNSKNPLQNGVNLNHVTYVLPKLEKTTSAVFTPKNPSTLKREEKQAEEAITGSVESVLAHTKNELSVSKVS